MLQVFTLAKVWTQGQQFSMILAKFMNLQTSINFTTVDQFEPKHNVDHL